VPDQAIASKHQALPQKPEDWTSVEFGSRLPYSPRLYTNTQICKLARELSLFALRLCTTSWQLAYRDRRERAPTSEHLADEAFPLLAFLVSVLPL
jgi:hypothetical protein